MNKIIIAGHPTSGLAEIVSLLLRCGMQSALPSRREKLLPEEITASLCNAHQAPALNSSLGMSDFRQIEPAAMWNALALDLAIGNSGQGIWGWADSRTIFLLDYWHQLDSQAAFVLIYDEPRHMLLAEGLGRSEPLNEEEIQKLLDNWAAYNGAMLHFFLRHPSRSVLVNARQACCGPDAFIELLQEQLEIQLRSISPNRADDGFASNGSDKGVPFTSPRATPLRKVPTPNHPAPSEALMNSHVTVAELYSIDCYLSEQPTYLQLFDELQAAASLPLVSASEITARTHTNWSDLIARPLVLARTFCQIHHQLRGLQTELKQSTEERDLMFLQLHQAQEELERYDLENRRLSKVPAKFPLFGAAKRVKQQLSYRLGATMVTRSRSLRGWLGMPFALLGEARRFNRDKKRPGQKKQPPIHQYKDAKDAERIKQQLSYRLGQTLITSTRSPIRFLKLPFALISEAIVFKKRLRQRRK